eukprot:6208777-Pleurochrysis_carterae.AAC.4
MSLRCAPAAAALSALHLVARSSTASNIAMMHARQNHINGLDDIAHYERATIIHYRTIEYVGIKRITADVTSASSRLRTAMQGQRHGDGYVGIANLMGHLYQMM